MSDAGAYGARTSWHVRVRQKFSRTSVEQKFGDTPEVAQLLRAYGHSRITMPLWAYFLKSEQFFRRLIPLLVILLLTFAAVARIGSMMNQAESLDEQAKREISLLGQLTALKLTANVAIADMLASPTLAEVFLEDALNVDRENTNNTRQWLQSNGLSVFLFDKNGALLAQQPKDSVSQASKFDEITVDGNLNLLPGETVKVRTVQLPGDAQALALYRMVNFADAQRTAGLLILKTDKSIYNGWYQRGNLNITLFLAMSIVLLVVLYAYFAQGARVRDTDALYTETNARFDTALSRGHCGLWDWDLSRGRIVWSKSMYQMLGMPPQDTVMGFGDLSGMMHPDDPDMISLANQAFQKDQTQIDHRLRMRHSSGQWVWMRLRAELVRYKGSAPHLIGIAVDISEQEALEQKTRDADIRLRDAIENISEAFVLWDAKKRLVMCNSKYQQLYNLPSSAVQSGMHYDMVMDKSRKPLARNLVPMLNKFENGTKTFEAQIENGNWLQISERRTRDGGFVSVGTDVTQIKRNHAKLVESERSKLTTIADLRSTKKTLEEKTRALKKSERIQSATIDDLRKTKQTLEFQAQKLVEIADDLNEQKNRADAGNKAKSEFLANISHELRTPLNAIIGFSDIMRSKMFGDLGSSKYDEYADDIHQSGSFLLGVINDVLDMSKIEAGRLQLNPEPVQLDELLSETLRIIQMEADKAEITVQDNIPESLELTADRRAMKQILLNLLSNAVKFTPEKGHIKVGAELRDDTVKIEIVDSGIGISEDALKRLGQPFEQVQDQFTKNHKGSGLGLAIARSLSTLHGGSLDITSKMDVGTTVVVTLPVECISQEDEVTLEPEPA